MLQAITRLIPNHGTTEGGTRITIMGRNFGYKDATPNVYIAGVACTDVVYVNPTKLSCLVAEGHGHSLPVVVEVADLKSNPKNGLWTYDGPVVDRISPK